MIATQSGEEALTLLDKGGMSLVLLDISLPGIDGLTILSYIRTHDDQTIALLPVIAMSAHVFTEEVDYYLCAGMNGFLGKPFSLEDLDHAIIQAINGHEVIITNTSQPGNRARLANSIHRWSRMTSAASDLPASKSLRPCFFSRPSNYRSN